MTTPTTARSGPVAGARTLPATPSPAPDTVPSAARPAVASAPSATAGTAAGTRGDLVELRCGERWLAVCGVGALTAGRGVAVLLPDGGQAAVFLDRAGRAYAVGNRDPFTGAQVLARGLLGSAGGAPFVASPLLKQRFDLRTGRCLDDAEVAVECYPCRVTGPAGD